MKINIPQNIKKIAQKSFTQAKKINIIKIITLIMTISKYASMALLYHKNT